VADAAAGEDFVMWVRREIAVLTEQDLGPDKGIPIAQGQMGERVCGCRWFLGTRLDSLDPTFALQPCFQHPQIANTTIHKLQTMPGSDREIGELCEELFELEASVPV
jgi:hypothetical protein